MKDVKIDDRMAFEAWTQTGTLEKATKLLANKGIYNTRTGEDFHPGSIKQASNRFILNNVAEARQVYRDQGSMLNEKQFEVKLILAACKVFSRKNFIKWVWSNPWVFNYPALVERRFPGLVEYLLNEERDVIDVTT